MDLQLLSARELADGAVTLRRRLAILDALTAAISESIELPSLLERSLGTVLEVTGVDGGGVFLLDERSGGLRLRIHRGVGQRLATSFAANPGRTLRALVTDANAPVIVRDITRLSRREELVQEGLCFYAGIPLQARGRVLGILVAVSHTQANLDDSDRELLISIGKQVGVAIERAQLYERERRRAQVMETISEAGRRLGAIRTERELLPSIIGYVCERLGYEAATVFLLNEPAVKESGVNESSAKESSELSDRELVIEAASGLGNEGFTGLRFPIEPEHSIVGWVSAHNEPLLANDVTLEPRYRQAGGQPASGAELAVPIRINGHNLGVLDVQSVRIDAFDEIDTAALQTLAGQIAVTIENARLHEHREHALRRRSAFQSILTAITASLDLPATLERTLDAAMSEFEADRAAIFFDEPDGSRTWCAAACNLSREYQAAVEERYTGAPALLEALQRQRSIYVEDAQRGSLVPGLREAARREGFHSQILLPLHGSTGLLGVFVLYHNQIRRYSDEEIALLQSFADHAAIAATHARLHEDTERALQRMRAFQRVTTAITASLDLPTTLERALEAAMEVFSADRAAIFLDHPVTKRTSCAASRRLSAGYLAAVEDHYAKTPSTRDVRRINTERSIYVEDAQRNPLAPPLADAARREGFRSMIFLPLLDDAGPFGVFVLYHDQIRRYADDEIALAQTFAHQARIAIQHARLFEAERHAREQAATILEATRNVASSLQLHDVLREAATCIAAAVRQRYCAVWLLNEEGTLLLPVAAIAEPPDPELERSLDFTALPPVALSDEPQLRAALEQGRPCMQEDLDDLCDVPRRSDGTTAFQSYLTVPLVTHDRTFGVVSVAVVERDHHFEPADVEVAMAIGHSAALAVENARLYEQAQRLAISEERNRLARELHDSVTQSLFSMTLMCQALPKILERDPQRARERIDRLNELGRGALAEMRALIFELRPAALEDEGLATALTKHANAFQSREGVMVHLTIEGERRLPAATEEGIFRVAQEALNNIAKHAGAKQVTVRLSLTETQAELTVSDDGVGFDDAASSMRGRTLGLTSMRERAVLLGGRCTVHSTPGEGTTVSLWAPLDGS